VCICVCVVAVFGVVGGGGFFMQGFWDSDDSRQQQGE
jgi:hypothetical protein